MSNGVSTGAQLLSKEVCRPSSSSKSRADDEPDYVFLKKLQTQLQKLEVCSLRFSLFLLTFSCCSMYSNYRRQAPFPTYRRHHHHHHYHLASGQVLQSSTAPDTQLLQAISTLANLPPQNSQPPSSSAQPQSQPPPPLLPPQKTDPPKVRFRRTLSLSLLYFSRRIKRWIRLRLFLRGSCRRQRLPSPRQVHTICCRCSPL